MADRKTLSLAAPDLSAFAWPDLTALVSEYGKLTRTLLERNAATKALIAQRREVDAADAAALAATIRAGEPAPPRQIVMHEAEILEAERLTKGVADARQLVATDIFALVKRDRASLDSDVRSAHEELQTEALGLLDELAVVLARRQAVQAVGRWLENPESSSMPAMLTVRGLRTTVNETAPAASDALAAIKAELLGTATAESVLRTSRRSAAELAEDIVARSRG
jgi:hypothetical protein